MLRQKELLPLIEKPDEQANVDLLNDAIEMYKVSGHPAPTARCILPTRGGNVLQQVNQTEARDVEWSCQAVSSMYEPCDSAATLKLVAEPRFDG